MFISKMFCLLFSLAFVASVVVGCSSSASKSSEGTAAKQATNTGNEANAEIMATMAELPADDREAAKAQKFCAVEQGNLLGSMGKPFKVVIEGQPVFLCCEGCKDKALKDSQATLATVAKLKQSNSSPK